MGIRETLNRNPTLTTGLTAGIIFLAILVIFWQSCDSGGVVRTSGKLFFSTDDGASYFPDDSTKIPPFDVGGKQAVRAIVYKCGANGKPFVLYLERYTKEMKQRLEDAKSKPIAGAPEFTGREVKKPGAKDWTPFGQGTKFSDIVSPKCPDGSTKDIEIVNP